VKFDVAVTVGEGTGTKGGIAVFVGAIGLGSQGESKTSQSSVSSIQFEVPISLPFTRSSGTLKASMT
jgi:small neutral amino acid transporter SnatA (MarC family)